MTPVDAAQMLNIGWQIADIARHFKVTNAQVIAAICEHVRQEREELRRLQSPLEGKKQAGMWSGWTREKWDREYPNGSQGLNYEEWRQKWERYGRERHHREEKLWERLETAMSQVLQPNSPLKPTKSSLPDDFLRVAEDVWHRSQGGWVN
jgi:hypothetical protein